MTTIEKQNEFFSQGNTLSIQTRIFYLKELKKAIIASKTEILAALKHDLNKSPVEAYASEISMVIHEITYMIKNIRRLSRTKHVGGFSFLNFPSSGSIYQEPYGVVLVMSPWNYPFQLALSPVIGAVAAGNCVVLKPSNYSSATSAIITKIINSVFPLEYVTVIQGGRDVNQTLLDSKFDFIFFTGGVTVGKLVMQKASQFLTPVVLELGGKSPCIVDETANISLAAKRIAWGKGLNAGQTCVAPDYLLVHESVHDQFIAELQRYSAAMFSSNPSDNDSFPKIINSKHFERLTSLLQEISSKKNTVNGSTAHIIYGGNSNAAKNRIDVTLIDSVNFSDTIMQDEIFGPILPIITFKELTDVASAISARPKPLALYLFSNSRKNISFIIKNVSFGGGCINDTILHLTNHSLPFGGVGNSGMGNYHGAQSFKTFSHAKSILKKSNVIDLNFRYPPYVDNVLPFMEKFLK